MVARYGAAYSEREKYLKKDACLFAPWVLGEIARVSLLYGSDFNREPATADDLVSCCAAYQALTDPGLERGAEGVAGDFFMRIAGEQLTFQQPVLHDLARTAALLELTTPRKTPKIATPGWPERLLGCSLQDYVVAAILLHTSALKNAGTFDLRWLTQPQSDEVTRDVPAEVLRAVLKTHYTATRTELIEVQRTAQLRTGLPDHDYRRFGFNPLASCPAIEGLARTLVIPVPGFIVRKASPLGVYYTGVAQLGNPFAEDLGELFEVYVGRQLDLLPDATVLPEIRYGRRKADLSVDWFAVFNDCVVLVEVKSTRPTESIRLADDRAGEELQRMLGHAIDQLNTSAAKVRSGEAGFEDVPSDRPLVGLIVTMEPFHTINTPFISSQLPQCDIPFAVCGSLELERLVTVSDVSVGRLLADRLTDSSKLGWSVNSTLEGRTLGRNAVIDQGWHSYPWIGN